MQLAILFWCYKDLRICRDRLEHLRRDNPHSPIYLLFGGEPADAQAFEASLGELVDDFYAFTDDPPETASDGLQAGFRHGVFWKYAHGDLLISAWHRDRGRHLPWDTVVIVQWDMLLFGPVDQLFDFLEPGEILFSGLRPVREVEEQWIWTQHSRPAMRVEYESFLAHVAERYDYAAEPLCCVAVVMCFPRAFLERYHQIECPALGFLEYRLPIYAQVFNTPIRWEHPYKPWWGAVEGYKLFSSLRALPREVWVPTIVLNRALPSGARIFHPYWRPRPRGILGWTLALLDSIPRILHAAWIGWSKRRSAQPGEGPTEVGLAPRKARR